ncbi:tetratricopeptide repeat protein, partial [candidate division NPL-UPA2 bacterium]|nr:tetratricopeptide repeat protein [candidate division NPL-UPA2 bacterium]
PDKGIAAYEKEALLEPDKSAVQEKLGDLYLGKEDFEKAKEKYRKVLEMEPNNRNIPNKLKEIDFKKFDVVIREYSEILQSQPDSSEAKEKMEKACHDKLNLQIQDCRERIQESPQELALRFELGKLYKERGEVDKALAEFQASVNEPQVKRQSLYMIGACFQERNILDMAVRQFQKALAESPGAMDSEAKEIHYQLGQLYEKMGEKKQALSQYKKIYEIDIAYKDIAQKIEAAYKTDTKTQS